MSEPEYNLNHTISGGHIADIPQPHIRYFPASHQKRKVTISITKFIGGRHYYLTIKQQDNPIWDAGLCAWVSCWDDDQLKDQLTHRDKFDYYEAAAGEARKICGQHFKGHKLIWEE